MENYSEYKDGKMTVIQRMDYKWGVISDNGEEIVPFGKYSWIDRFEKGLARVIKYSKSNDHTVGCKMWGIINEQGEEVLPLEYQTIWNFYGKNRLSTKIIKDGHESELNLHDLNPSIPRPETRTSFSTTNSYRRSYSEYAGSYAQDVMGYSDDLINDAFEGDPDAYWNIN